MKGIPGNLINYNYVFLVVLGFELRALHLPGRALLLDPGNIKITFIEENFVYNKMHILVC
jgi:hypothetical protein